jgi:hypothetical protein
MFIDSSNIHNVELGCKFNVVEQENSATQVTALWMIDNNDHNNDLRQHHDLPS